MRVNHGKTYVNRAVHVMTAHLYARSVTTRVRYAPMSFNVRNAVRAEYVHLIRLFAMTADIVYFTLKNRIAKPAAAVLTKYTTAVTVWIVFHSAAICATAAEPVQSAATALTLPSTARNAEFVMWNTVICAPTESIATRIMTYCAMAAVRVTSALRI